MIINRLFYSILSFIIGSILLTSCSSTPKEKIATTPPIEVAVAQVASDSQTGFISASGILEAQNSADLSTRIMGFVTSFKVKMGQKVSKGQLIATISNDDLEAQKRQAEAGIMQAQANFNNAQKDYNRFENLFSKNSATQKELDDMTTRVEAARASLKMAKEAKNAVVAQMAYTQIVAPFPGEITQVFLKAGDLTHPGMPLAHIEGSGKLQAKAMVSEDEIGQITIGMPAKVRVKSLSKEFDGQVVEKSISGNQTGGRYLIKIDLDDAPDEVMSGMIVDVIFLTTKVAKEDNSQGKILIQKEALVEQGQLKGVYVVSPDHQALLRWIQVGRDFGNQIEVLSGLKKGEKYVTHAEGRLYNGVKIKE